MKKNKKEIEMFTFDEIKNEFIGKVGSKKRNKYEQKLSKILSGKRKIISKID